MWSGQHQQSTKPRIPQQLASIIMPKENVVYKVEVGNQVFTSHGD